MNAAVNFARRASAHVWCLMAFAAYAGLVRPRTLRLEATQLVTEAPLLLYAYTLSCAPLRARRWRLMVGALPLAWFYLVHDEYLARWGNVPNFADFAMLPDLFTVLGPLGWTLVVTALALPLLGWALAIDPRVLRTRPRRLWLTAPAVACVAMLLFAPRLSYETLEAVTEDVQWSDRRTVERWGRIFSTLFRQARRGSFAEGLRAFTPLERSKLRVDSAEHAAIDRRNVHLVVLESFVDLRLMRSATFSESPFAPGFAARFDPFISASISPVFGGETARAEFEVLCGVPSLRLYGLEFLAFSGARTYCLPSILRDAGYDTVLSFPHGPVFFNTRRAYPGLGFAQVIYGDRFVAPGAESIAMGEADYLEDGDLFPQNLRKVRALVERGRPFLNYVLTIYGHWPFDIDVQRHPQTIRVTPPDSDLEKIARQMRARTEALDEYLRGLVAADPDGLIVLVADHLPPLPGGANDYVRLGYRGRDRDAASDLDPYDNFLLVLAGGKAIKLPRMRHFDLPHWILNELSHGAHCRNRTCDFGRLPLVRERYLDAYQTILGLASQPATNPLPR